MAQDKKTVTRIIFTNALHVCQYVWFRAGNDCHSAGWWFRLDCRVLCILVDVCAGRLPDDVQHLQIRFENGSARERNGRDVHLFGPVGCLFLKRSADQSNHSSVRLSHCLRYWHFDHCCG